MKRLAMRRTLHAMLFATGITLALAAPGWALVVSHNGTDYPGGTIPLNGTGAVNVWLGCTENSADYASCIKFFWSNSQTHIINWSGSELLEFVLNNTGVPWTDYHLAFQNMDFFGAGIPLLPPGTQIVATFHSLDLFFSEPILPGNAIVLDMHFGNFNGNGLGVIEQYPTVPEPATILLLGSGLIGLAGYGRKKFFKK